MANQLTPYWQDKQRHWDQSGRDLWGSNSLTNIGNGMLWDQGGNKLYSEGGGFYDLGAGVHTTSTGHTRSMDSRQLDMWKNQIANYSSPKPAPAPPQDQGGAVFGGLNANGTASAAGPTYPQPTDSRFANPLQTGPALMGSTSGAAPGGAGGAGAANSGNPYSKEIFDFAMGQARAGVGGSGTVGQNPYLKDMGDWMTGQMTDNFSRNVMPAMNSGTMAAGGYGGSRQGVLQANAQNDLQKQIGGALTNLYGQGYNTDLQYDMQLRNNALGWGNVAQGLNSAQMNYDLGLRNNDLGWGNLQSSYDLGRRNNDLGFAGLDRQINNDNLSWQLQGAQFGLGLYDRMNANNQGIYGVGQNIQNTPLNYWQMFSNQSNAFGQGYGTQTNTMPTQGNPMMGAMGGMQMGSQLGRMWGGNSWMGGGSNPNVAGDAYMPAYQPLSGITF